jgi:hypothetical protein
MPFKHFSLKRRRRRSRSPTSHDQLPARKYCPRTTIISFADLFWPGDTTVTLGPVSQIDTQDDIAMSAIQTSLAVLQQGSSLATQLPFIAPIAGLLLQALTMRDVRITHMVLLTTF